MCYNLMKEEILIRLREMKADVIERLQVKQKDHLFLSLNTVLIYGMMFTSRVHIMFQYLRHQFHHRGPTTTICLLFFSRTLERACGVDFERDISSRPEKRRKKTEDFKNTPLKHTKGNENNTTPPRKN